jgi:predicted transcriptional regulator
VLVDVFCVLLDNKEIDGSSIIDKVKEFRKENSLDLKGVAGSNIRRQLKRLKDLFLVEKKGNNYRIAENEKLSHLFEEKIEKFHLKNIVSRVKEYFEHLDNLKK